MLIPPYFSKLKQNHLLRAEDLSSLGSWFSKKSREHEGKTSLPH